MRISVVIPAYNAQRYMAKCILSLKGQTVSPYEIIVVNDGSTDRTSKIAKSLGGAKIVNHPVNRGIAAARNTGIRNSMGDIVAFMDSDCIARNDWLENIGKDYSNPAVGGVGGRGIETTRFGVADEFRFRYCRQSHGDKKRYVDILWGLNMSFRRNVISKAGGFNEFFRTNGEDVEFSLRAAKTGYRLLYDPSVVVYHLKRDDLFSILRTVNRCFKFGYMGQVIGGAANATPRRVLGKTKGITDKFLYRLRRELPRGNPRIVILSFLSMIAELFGLRAAWISLKRQQRLVFSRETGKTG